MAKVSDVKKAIKACDAEISVYRASAGSYDVFKCNLRLTRPSAWSTDPKDRDTYLYVEFQANDLFHPSNDSENMKPAFLHLEGVGHWYAGHIDTESRFSYGGSDYKDPSRAEAFFEIVKGVIEKFNLSHVYPDCELSQVLAALDKLGVTIRKHQATIERSEVYAWNEARMEARPAGFVERHRR